MKFELSSNLFYLCRTMKLFIRIFSIYFLALTFLPCGDMGSACNDNLEETSYEMISTSSDQHGHEGDCGDSCSPFCFCTCCGSTILNVDPAPIQQALAIPIPTNKPFYCSDFLPQLFLSQIWHPPKL